MRKILFNLFLALSTVALFMAAPTMVMAQNAKSDICSGATFDTGCNNTPGPSATDVVRDVVDLLSLLIGVIAVIMAIVAGFRYVTSNGDSSKISGAKDTLIYALVGIVVAALGQAIVQFVLNKVGIK